ncbi:hypothetical protein COB11_08560 [Candidatus Aerophobetes bacterium]|uniref:Uncharacterized protein n=1 Tax=Aerophobetes bacterium TaxID=2030807 RepID=A0A2A4Y8F0_UNCAE|nr:MAG: hypothetical protein COB11_08560 [Candidatus Aerophobetes bacterium]
MTTALFFSQKYPQFPSPSGHDHQHFSRIINDLIAYRDNPIMGFSDASKVHVELLQVKGDIHAEIQAGNCCLKLAALLNHSAFQL